jgi:hypothetical protein
VNVKILLRREATCQEASRIENAPCCPVCGAAEPRHDAKDCRGLRLCFRRRRQRHAVRHSRAMAVGRMRRHRARAPRRARRRARRVAGVVRAGPADDPAPAPRSPWGDGLATRGAS